MKSEIETYIRNNDLESIIQLKGNQSKQSVLKAYQTSRFLILIIQKRGLN